MLLLRQEVYDVSTWEIRTDLKNSWTCLVVLLGTWDICNDEVSTLETRKDLNETVGGPFLMLQLSVGTVGTGAQLLYPHRKQIFNKTV